MVFVKLKFRRWKLLGNGTQLEIRNLEENTLKKVSEALEHASKHYG
jgi:hypothetical protein